MRKTVTGVAVLVLSLGSAATAAPTLAGTVCEFGALPADENTWVAEIDGGPIAAVDVKTVAPDVVALVRDNPVSVTLTCSIQVGWTTDHTGTPVASVSASGDGVAVLAPTPVTFDDPSGDSFFGLCTRLDLTGQDGGTSTLYWDVYEEEFSTDPTVPCGPVFCPLSARDACNSLPDLVRVIFERVDSELCPVFADEFGDDGDVYVGDELVWDCPPYRP